LRALRRRALTGWIVGMLASLAPLGQPLAALRVAVVSDLNSAYGSTSYEAAVGDAMAALLSLGPALVISTGDMVAGQRLHPPLARPRVEAMWAAFHAAVTEPLQAAGIPLAVTPGNHDASAYPAFTLEREIYRAQWQPRSTGLQMVDGEHYPFHYAFALQDVLFVSLDATRVGALPEAQKDWLDGLLKQQGPRFLHRVVFSHLPIYPITHGRETEVTADHELERILQRHGVELYLSGHHHAFYPGYRDGIRHVSQACLGAGPRVLLGAQAASPRGVTWLEFDDQGVTVTGLTGRRLEARIDPRSLPESVVSRYGTLVREDLRPTPAALNPAGSDGLAVTP
jgi:3',5'-cyclic AMP phosphodiesterase CpdA